MRVDHKGTDEEVTLINPKVKAFLDMTPAEVGQYIDTHVTSLTTAKEMLVTMGMLMSVMAKEIKENR